MLRTPRVFPFFRENGIRRTVIFSLPMEKDIFQDFKGVVD